MVGRPNHDAVIRLLRLLGERLESYLDGDEMAFEHLAEVLDEQQFTGEDIHAAVLVLKTSAADGPSTAGMTMDALPGRDAHRVLSAEERATLTPEAWGYLLDLRRHGSLDASQVERVLDLLTGSGIRPVGVELAREVATRVALDVESSEDPGDLNHGDVDIAH